MTVLRLGLPSKGRLKDQAADWLASRGMELVPGADDREYAARLTGVGGVALVLLAAAEIPRDLAAGRIHYGITGQDMMREKLPRWTDHVAEVLPLGFGRADLVIAVPRAWRDVAGLDDLDAVAAAFRAEHGFRLRIATKYHHLTRAFLKAAEVADYQLVDSQGATEATVKNLHAEAISDITSSGATLKANHLKVLEDGLILRSEAVLFRSLAARAPAGAEAAFAAMAGFQP
jgi:ATP phosphoribosyltransferase